VGQLLNTEEQRQFHTLLVKVRDQIDAMTKAQPAGQRLLSAIEESEAF